MTHRATIYVHYSALQVALLKAGELDASEALADWADEWLDPIDTAIATDLTDQTEDFDADT